MTTVDGKKIRIAIELNGVIRNINKQILKYYQKDYDRTIDLDEVDEKDDPFKVAKFDSERAKFDFMHVDYPFEIFGCAKAMESLLPALFNNWLGILSDEEDYEFEIVLFSMDETALSVQSSFFFLSKIGARVRKIIFPIEYAEISDMCDVVITANGKTIDSLDTKYKVLVKMTNNGDYEEKADAVYGSMKDIIDDSPKFLEGIKTYFQEKTEE